MNLVGFIIGAICAIIFWVVANALIVFRHSNLVFGLIALLIWLAFTFGYAGNGPFAGGSPFTRRGPQ
jgi:hypothetical protein